MAVIETKDVTRWYGNVIALTRVNAQIESGITALLGPNGAGKSTLLGILTGQLAATMGTVRIFGEPVWGNHDLNRRMGICHQYDNFYEDMTATEFTILMARLSGFKRKEVGARVREMLQEVGLEEKAWKRKIKGFSKGMRQRVKLAQAMIHRPDLLFLDEPMTGLDPVGRHEIAAIIKSWADQGKTVVVSTHILHEVEDLTNQILLLADGRVVAEGDVHDIRSSLEDHPYSIKVVCDKPRELAASLVGHEAIESIIVEEHDTVEPKLFLETRRADEVFTMITSNIAKFGLQVTEISSPDDNLEAVFEYLLRDSEKKGGL
ncbi:MAG: ABC-2 type transport system ATP-binding protein [Planctomycetota bacterium]|jgi:ABC-2 type transport system ATP-binding protein